MANVCRCICDFEQFARLPQLKAAMVEAQCLMERIENLVSLWVTQGTGGCSLRLRKGSLLMYYVQSALFGTIQVGGISISSKKTTTNFCVSLTGASRSALQSRQTYTSSYKVCDLAHIVFQFADSFP